MTPVEADAAVARGARVLDERGPAGWREVVRAAIRDGRLDMSSAGPVTTAGCGCVLAWTYGEYFRALDRFTGAMDEHDADSWAADHGFLCEDGDSDAYRALAAAWARLLGAEVPA